MLYLARTWLFLFSFMALLIANMAAQDRASLLGPGSPVTFSLEPNQEKVFTLQLTADGYAEINWLADDDVMLLVEIFDSQSKRLESAIPDDWDADNSLTFVAPKDGAYKVVVSYMSESTAKGKQNISIELINRFKLPAAAKLKDSRMLNGYNIKIMSTADENYVLFEKNGVLSEVNDDDSIVRELDSKTFEALKNEKQLFAGILPKIDNAFDALRNGADCVLIGNSIYLGQLIKEESGTKIVL